MAIVVLVSPIPDICISPAPAQESTPEPKSPFATLSPLSPVDDDGYRSALLTPPSNLSPGCGSPLSPLRPADAPVKGRGVDRERFEALLRASRERNAAVGAKKEKDLRKEIALKAHKCKQVERRALFLSKVQAPPSPSAALLPKTPPESPALLHYSLPSPGLASPLAHFDSMRSGDEEQRASQQPWVEQVDFRLPEAKRTTLVKPASSPKKHALPSLEEISARLGAQRQAAAAADTGRRLPAFLQTSQRQASPPPVVEAPAPASRPASVGRLRMPVRAGSGPLQKAPTPLPTVIVSMVDEPEEMDIVPDLTSKVPDLRINTRVFPHKPHASPMDLTDVSPNSFTPRIRTASDMLFTLRRRNGAPLPTGSSADGTVAAATVREDWRKSMRRRSAPSELPVRERTGFVSPRLALPGAF